MEYPVHFLFCNANTRWKRGISVIVAVEDDAGHFMTGGVD
jgi:hypothetical protein